MNKKTIIIFVVAAAAAIIAAVFWVYYAPQKEVKEETKETEEIGQEELSTGTNYSVDVDMSNVGKGTESVLKNMPSANPLEEVANPFRDPYKNPFK